VTKITSKAVSITETNADTLKSKENFKMAYTGIITQNATFPSPNTTSVLSFVANARAVTKQRRALASLTASQLNDIGISPAQCAVECKRRFWQRG
jgi:uncharacterized protein YjiS (DUF1127 family)